MGCKHFKEASASTKDNLGVLLLGHKVLGFQRKPQQSVCVELLLCAKLGASHV